MFGWSTRHQECTPAKGDPIAIKKLIQQFKLEEIVSFDEFNNLITTTFYHNRHIRLSDLITLNVTNLITFSLNQYFNVIAQLFSLIDQMKQNQISHGNLTLENIILDLSCSQCKLDNNHQQIQFELKLINFAQFYSQPHVVDFYQVCLIYQQILQQFPYTNQINNMKQSSADYILEMKSIIQWQGDWYFQGIQFENVRFKMQNIYNHKLTNMCSETIGNLHRYHLIINHNKFQQSIDYFKDPQEFLSACNFVDKLLEIDIQNLIEKQKQLMNTQNLKHEQIDEYLIQIKKTIQQNIVIYLKQQGYFQNIQKFVEIVNNYERLNDFKKNQIQQLFCQPNAQSTKNLNQIYYVKFPQEIEQTYIVSIQILRNMIQQQQISNDTTNFDFIIKSLNNIKNIGYKYSKILIDHCITENFEKQLKSKNLPNADNLISFMVNQWIKWIDQYIFNFQFDQIQHLDQINKQTFIQFIEEQGFLLLQEELKKQIEQIVYGIKLN